ncbi:MAG: glycosyltransferase family 4 protein [Proteobacteria bacterium]|nr:glycosyltransferase family 4 protein [Pseudomonadota bacterium]
MKSTKARVLLIHYYFPPRGGVAVQRFLKFCKYLECYDCRVFVLTSGAEYTSFRDDSLCDSISPSTLVFTTHKPGQKQSIEGQFGRKNIFLDAFLSWAPVAINKARKIIRLYDIDVIFTTSPPHSQQLIGLFLKTASGIPWIADFRDPWTSDSRFMKNKRNLQFFLEKYVEKLVLQRADVVIATTRKAAEAFCLKAPRRCQKRKFECITNGYDPADYGSGSAKNSIERRLVFTYVGSTGQYISDPSYFLRALRQVLNADLDLEKILVRFVGNKDRRTEDLIRNLDLERVVKNVGNIPHKKAIEFMLMSDILLLFEIPVDTERPTMVIPSKIFEYMGAQRPVMAMVAEGDTADLVREYGLGEVINPTSIKDIAKAIWKYSMQFGNGELRRPDSPPADFTRKEQSRRLAGIIHGLRR